MSYPDQLSIPPPLKTLLCDMGNVLVFFCHDRMCRQIGELCGRTAGEVRERLINSQLQWEFERGWINEKVLHERLQDVLGCRLDFPALVRACADIFELNGSMIPVLTALKLLEVRLVLLSNTCISHVNFIRSQWNVLDLFDHLVLSYEVGAIKPEEAIYRSALEQIHCLPEECLYVDDIAGYVEKGRSFGLRSEVFTTTENLVTVLQQIVPDWKSVYAPRS